MTDPFEDAVRVAIAKWRGTPKMQEGEGMDAYLDRKMRAALTAALPFLVPKPGVRGWA